MCPWCLQMTKCKCCFSLRIPCSWQFHIPPALLIVSCRSRKKAIEKQHLYTVMCTVLLSAFLRNSGCLDRQMSFKCLLNMRLVYFSASSRPKHMYCMRTNLVIVSLKVGSLSWCLYNNLSIINRIISRRSILYLHATFILLFHFYSLTLFLQIFTPTCSFICVCTFKIIHFMCNPFCKISSNTFFPKTTFFMLLFLKITVKSRSGSP